MFYRGLNNFEILLFSHEVNLLSTVNSFASIHIFICVIFFLSKELPLTSLNCSSTGDGFSQHLYTWKGFYFTFSLKNIFAGIEFYVDRFLVLFYFVFKLSRSSEPPAVRSGQFPQAWAFPHQPEQNPTSGLPRASITGLFFNLSSIKMLLHSLLLLFPKKNNYCHFYLYSSVYSFFSFSSCFEEFLFINGWAIWLSYALV